jgi:hypothetical protein
MPVPLPSDDDTLHGPPDAAEAQAVASAIAYLVTPPSGLTHLQRLLLGALFKEMTEHEVDVTDPPPITPEAFAQLLARRTVYARERIVQVMLLCALVLRPLPPEIADHIETAARELGVAEGMTKVAADFADQSYALAAQDFDRNGYVATWQPDAVAELHTSTALMSAWAGDVDDPALAARWAALGDLPQGTLGRGVWQMYQARGFVFPGLPGSAPPLLAQHDWVHVLADYGTTVESELEVFGLIARANDDMHAFSLLAMVISLFETGSLAKGAGLFEASPGHLSANEGVAVREADAKRRGARCHVDFLGVDWFEFAALTLDAARAHFGITPKSDDALRAGSVGPWEPGGISPFQRNSGQQLAQREGRAYDAHGASVLAD